MSLIASGRSSSGRSKRPNWRRGGPSHDRARDPGRLRIAPIRPHAAGVEAQPVAPARRRRWCPWSRHQGLAAARWLVVCGAACRLLGCRVRLGQGQGPKQGDPRAEYARQAMVSAEGGAEQGQGQRATRETGHEGKAAKGKGQGQGPGRESSSSVGQGAVSDPPDPRGERPTTRSPLVTWYRAEVCR